MDDEERDWLRRRIQSLRSRQQSVGPFRQAGIQVTIDSMREQLRTDTWRHPHGVSYREMVGRTPPV